MNHQLHDNLEAVRTAIARAAARSKQKVQDVTLVAVSKTRSAAEARAAWQCGVHDFGENRVQEAVPKIESLGDLNATWHMIGSLQTNKVRQIFPQIELLHSLDRWSLAREVNRCANRFGRPLSCLVQVNIAGEASKSGLDLAEVKDFIDAVVADCPGTQISGLMAMAPYVDDPEQVRCYFRQMKTLYDELAQVQAGYTMEHLSMGMSGDYEVAIEEGANLVRIGTAIFGRRDA